MRTAYHGMVVLRPRAASNRKGCRGQTTIAWAGSLWRFLATDGESWRLRRRLRAAAYGALSCRVGFVRQVSLIQSP
jgi:hypothetical protein